MEPRLQRRVQRYGWDLAAAGYEQLWKQQLAPAHAGVFHRAALATGEHVLDVACGTGIVSFAAARAVGTSGRVTGVDISGQMVEFAAHRADVRQVHNARFLRMDAENLDFPDASFDVVTCALGLMYMPDPVQALREMRRVLRPGGRLALAVWGDRSLCGWSEVFRIVDAEVESDVCPLFFSLGETRTLEYACRDAGFPAIRQHRMATVLEYASGDDACEAAFVGGPVALAWSRFDGPQRLRVRERYLEAIDECRHGRGYRIPGEFVVATAVVPEEKRPLP